LGSVGAEALRRRGAERRLDGAGSDLKRLHSNVRDALHEGVSGEPPLGGGGQERRPTPRESIRLHELVRGGPKQAGGGASSDRRERNLKGARIRRERRTPTGGRSPAGRDPPPVSFFSADARFKRGKKREKKNRKEEILLQKRYRN